MSSKIFAGVIIVVSLLLFVLMGYKSINKSINGYDFVDTNYHFNRAIIRMPDGEIIEVEIAQWADCEGEQLTITDKNGRRYLVSSINCVLIEDETNE